MVVGQAYMAEINKQLEGITSGITAIQREMKRDRDAKIEARFEKLREYLALYDTISIDPEKKQAVLNSIELICIGALGAWKFQVSALQDFSVRIGKSKRVKQDEVEALLREFQNRERDAQTALRFIVAAEQASMQYDADFSEARIERERSKLGRYLDEYEQVRSQVRNALTEKIEGIRSDLIAIPAAKKEAHQHPVLGVLHLAGANAQRLLPSSLRKEAKRRHANTRNSYRRLIDADDPIEIVGDKRKSELALLNFIYDEADTMLLDGDGIHFVKTHCDAPAGRDDATTKANDQPSPEKS